MWTLHLLTICDESLVQKVQTFMASKYPPSRWTFKVRREDAANGYTNRDVQFSLHAEYVGSKRLTNEQSNIHLNLLPAVAQAFYDGITIASAEHDTSEFG